MNTIFSLFRFCPHCGARAFHPISDKKMQCGSCDFEYYINPSGAVAGIILDQNNKILLTRRGKEPAKGMWDLPGGFIDFHETVEDALCREIREEVNLDVTVIGYLCSFPNTYPYGGILYHTIDMFFLCRAICIPDFEKNDEISEYQFVDPDRINLHDIGMDSIRNALSFYVDHR